MGNKRCCRAQIRGNYFGNGALSTPFTANERCCYAQLRKSDETILLTASLSPVMDPIRPSERNFTDRSCGTIICFHNMFMEIRVFQVTDVLQ